MKEQILNGNIDKIKEFVSKLDVKIPEDTLYSIDKVVRNRMREGRFGKDFSEYINLESEEEHKYHYYHHEMLRLGKTSIQIPFVPHSILLREKLDKSPILPQNKPRHTPSVYETIRKPKQTKRAKTLAKYGSVQKGKGPIKEDFIDWRMKKRAEERLRNKLIRQAKDEIRQQILNDLLKIAGSMALPQENDQSRNDTKENDQPLERESPTFGKDELPKRNFKNFKEFCLMTTGEYYPNPMF